MGNNKVRSYLKENIIEFINDRGIKTEKPFNAYKDIIVAQIGKFTYESYKYFLQGLGDFIGDDIFYLWDGNYRKCRSIVYGWLEEPIEDSKISDTDCENLMAALCWRELNFLINKENWEEVANNGNHK